MNAARSDEWQVKRDKMKPSNFESRKAAGYQDLPVRQKNTAVAKLVYAPTKTFPADEKPGLVSQIRCAAVSIVAIVAEGQARPAPGEFVQLISHAAGSVVELWRALNGLCRQVESTH